MYERRGDIFREMIEFIRGGEYQQLLVEYSKKLESAGERLSEITRNNLLKESEITLRAKFGIMVNLDGETKLVKPSNEDERKALIVYLMGEEAVERKALEDEVKMYESLSKNMRQNLSAEQTRINANKTGDDAERYT